MAGMLPYLGHDALAKQIYFGKSWKDPATWVAARTRVPEFLDPTDPQHLQWASWPGLPLDVAATHVVGIAGIGPNAAEWTDDNPEAAGKLGAFGYNRMASLAQIEKGRGLSNTAVMIQVSPGSSVGMTPWLAGGGSTVRSIPETDSIKPFLHNYGGKTGVYVIMGDGSVRFVNANIDNTVFQQMCTIGAKTPEFEAEFNKNTEKQGALAPPPPGKDEKKPAPTPDKSAMP
jgi:hypothetical protein